LVNGSSRARRSNGKIVEIRRAIADPELAWLFENCFPNTLDTTVTFGTHEGRPDTYVITGDINAMWLRDSTAQVTPYLPFARKERAQGSGRRVPPWVYHTKLVNHGSVDA